MKILIGLFLFIALNSCGLLSRSKVEKANLVMAKKEQNSKNELMEKEKAHFKLQAKEGRKMMKRTKRASNKLNKYKSH